MDLISQLSPLSPGLIDELAAFMGPGSEGCYATQPVDARRIGGHQLPESPPDSGSENPYSPSENHAVHTITVPQTALNPEYSMLVHEHLQSHDLLHSNGYIYEGLKTDSMHDVVVLQDQDIMELGSVRHDLILADQMSYQNKYMPELEQSMINPQMVPSHEILAPVFTNTGLQEPSSKKRKHSPDNSQVKCEPAALSPESVSQHMSRPAPSSADGSEAGDDLPLQCIRFATFQQASWHTLYDCNYKQLATISYVVGADKGFNYSPIDEAFVCQKKNHFQVTCQIQAHGEPQYVKTGEGCKKIIGFRLHFFGVKAEDPSQEVRVEQSQSDRTKKPFHPVPVELRREGSKMTVGRLHFAETTNNNMRKKGRPNPDQRHFQLVVALRAQTQLGDFTVAAQASDRIIVRASNPGQFESDCTESWWQRGVSENSVHFTGKVGINTDRPDESCVINGNLKVMGHVVQPSDARAKHNIEELDTAQQLKNVQNIRVVKFNYDPSFAEHSGLLGFDPSSPSPRTDTGVIAQEVRRVLPEAVKEAGDVTLPNGDTIQKFLVVNKDRIFMENLGAVKELCKVTGNLESRIHQLERINKKLCGIQRRDSARSSISNDSHFSVLSTTSRSYSDCNNKDQLRDIARNIRRHECCHKLSHNSPKYTRKQCKNCHGASRYGKFYNYNKTCVRYYNKSDKSDNASCNFPTYVETAQSSPIQKMPDESLSTLKSKDTCLWLKEESYACGNSRLALCCKRKDRFGDDTELISNKFLQIVITILIFIMAVCLVVMSTLYFKEHRELLSMREIRQDKYSDAPGSYRWDGKINSAYRATPPDPNQIHNTRLSQHPKTARDKAPLKTTQAYVTTAATEPPRATTTPFPIRIVKPWNIEQQPRAIKDRLEVILTHRTFENLIGSCGYANSDNKLDAECQLSCPDPPQAYENQEPLERTNPEKENETFESIPVTPARNLTENKLKSEKVALKKQIRDDSTNFIEISKQNGTEGGRRHKRGVRKVKRQTNEALPESASKDWSSDDQNDDIEECESTTVGVYSPLLGNTSQFTERACSFAVYNYTYTVPLAQCLHNEHAHITLRTTTLTTQLVLCDLRCKYESVGVVKGCRASRDAAAPQRSLDTWTSKVKLDCNTSTAMKIRAGNALENLCSITPEDKIPFSEYNFHLVQSCPN